MLRPQLNFLNHVHLCNHGFHFVGIDLCYSIGWLMKQTEDVIAIAQTVGIETHAQTIQIPAGMVIGVTEIEMGIDICPQALSKMKAM